MTIVDDLRGVGLTMGGRYPATSFTDPVTNEDMTSTLCVGWTTDQAKADAARELGATVTRYTSTYDASASGWEVSVRVIA